MRQLSRRQREGSIFGYTAPSRITNIKNYFNSGDYPNTKIYMDGAVQFYTSDKAYLSVSDNTTISATSILEIGLWVYIDSVASTQNIFIKGVDYSTASTLEYGLAYVQSIGNFRFYVSDGATISSIDDTGSSVSATTWYFLRMGRKNDGTLFIQRNDNAEITSAGIAAIQDSNNSLNIGINADTALYFGGRIDSMYITKTISSSSEALSLYNSGNGRMISDLNSMNGLDSFKTNCISWWGFNEEGGIRYDAIGSNHLTSMFNNIIDATTLNGGFETAGGGGADVFASWAELVTGTSTLTRDTTTFAVGVASCRMDIDASNSIVGVSQNLLRNAAKYKLTAKIRHNKGSSITTVQVGIGEVSDVSVTVPAILTDTWTDFTYYFTSGTVGTVFALARPSSAGLSSKSYWLDAVTLVNTEIPSNSGIASGLSSDGNLCASFNGTSQYLEKSSNASLQTGDIDFSVYGWVNYSDLSTTQYTIAKYANPTREYTVGITSGNLRFQVSRDGTGIDGILASSVVISPNTWFFVICSHDSVNDLISIQINNGTIETTPYSLGLTAAGTAFSIGSAAGGATPSKAKIDSVGFIKKVLTDSERTALFNNGKGVKYSGIPSTMTSDASLSHWDLGEYSAGTSNVTRSDSGSNGNNLTSSGNTPSAQGVNYFEGTISKWYDELGASTTIIQTTQSNKLLYITNSLNGRPAIFGDGLTKTIYNSSDIIGTSDLTICAVIKPIGWGGASVGRIIDNGKFILGVQSSTNSLIGTSNGATYVLTSNPSIVLGNTYILIITRNSSGKWNFYINGVSDGGSDLDSGAPQAGGATYVLNRSGLDRGFYGNLYTLLIYNKVLSSNEITGLNNYFKTYFGL